MFQGTGIQTAQFLRNQYLVKFDRYRSSPKIHTIGIESAFLVDFR